MPVMCTAWSEDRKHTASAMSWSESQSTGSRERCVVKNLGEAFAAARMGIPMIDFGVDTTGTDGIRANA